MAMTHREVHARSLRDCEGFWAEAAEDIHWVRRWDSVLDASRAPFYRWFSGGLLNTCYNAVDLHVEQGRGEQRALVHDSPLGGVKRTFTYRELQNEVAHLAGALRKLGVEKGDRVLLYMPAVPEAVFAMLACARLGAVHSVVFGGFAPKELSTRIDDAKPKVVMSASCGLEPNRVIHYKPLLEQALAMSHHAPDHCLILQRSQHEATMVPGRDVDWREAVAAAPAAECVPVAATDPLYILYTSGTTGIPKGIVRDNGGHAVALKWSMEHVYGVRAGETLWAASDIGWAVGHSYIVYGPLLRGSTAVLYEGKPVGTPDPGRVLPRGGGARRRRALHGAHQLPRHQARGPARRAPQAHDLSRLRALFLAGERCDPDTLEWAHALLGIPVIDHWWQTETGWPAIANCLGIELLPIKPGSPAKAVPGYDIRVLDAHGERAPARRIGNVAIALPLPPGACRRSGTTTRAIGDRTSSDTRASISRATPGTRTRTAIST